MKILLDLNQTIVRIEYFIKPRFPNEAINRHRELCDKKFYYHNTMTPEEENELATLSGTPGTWHIVIDKIEVIDTFKRDEYAPDNLFTMQGFEFRKIQQAILELDKELPIEAPILSEVDIDYLPF